MPERQNKFVVVLRQMGKLFHATWELHAAVGGSPKPSARGEALFDRESTALIWAQMEAEKLGTGIDTIERIGKKRPR